MIALTSLTRPFLLGVVTGARSQLVPALLARGPGRAADPAPLRLLRTPAGRALTTLAAAGELVGDKLPRTPSRLAPPVFAARLVVGAAVGAAVTDTGAGTSPGAGRVLGAVAGAAGAAAWSWLGATGRGALPARTGTPDWFWAGVEDAGAVALGAAAVRGR